MASKSRAWCLTVNNYTEEERQAILHNSRSDYVIVGKETGDSGTPHLQGYIRFPNAVRLSTLKKMFPRAHLEIARGTPEENYKYCSKDGDFEEAGDRPSFAKHLEGIIYSVDTLGEQSEGLSTEGDIAFMRSLISDVAIEVFDLYSEFEGMDMTDYAPADSDEEYIDVDMTPL